MGPVVRGRLHGYWGARIVFLAFALVSLGEQAAFATANLQSVTKDCVGAGPWLTATEERFYAILPTVLVDDMDFDTAAYRDALLVGQREQAQSSPPDAAVGLNSQVLAVFALAAASVGGVLTPGDISMTEADADAISQATQRARMMARELKRYCNLTDSGEFFDALCYGPAAREWYDRTNARALALKTNNDEAKGELLGSLTVEEETDLANRLARSVGDLFEEQNADPPPSVFSALHQHFLDTFWLISDMFSWSMTADEAQWQEFDAAIEATGIALDREKARLDIECPNPT